MSGETIKNHAAFIWSVGERTDLLSLSCDDAYPVEAWVVFSCEGETYVGREDRDGGINEPRRVYDATNALVLLRPLLTGKRLVVSRYSLDWDDAAALLEATGYCDGFDEITLDDEPIVVIEGPDGELHLVPEEMDDHVLQGWYHNVDDGVGPVSWEHYEEICRIGRLWIARAFNDLDGWVYRAVGRFDDAGEGLRASASVCVHLAVDEHGNCIVIDEERPSE